jgi:hypothetical protein
MCSGIREREPACQGIRAIWSPHTGTLSVPDPIPDPDPQDPHFFGPPEFGSVSISQRIRIIKQKYCKKNLDSCCFVTSFGLFVFEK